ncbi:hypothetical protein JNW87_24400, partial [Micromonospora sp. ATA51]|nr:hypothetical protein [Micromonospora sp. ATA51]
MEIGPRPPAGPPGPPPAPARERTGPWPVVAAVLVGGWTALVTVLGQVVGWAVDQAVLVAGLDRAVPTWPLVALGTVLLVGAPTLALALLPRSPAVRATGRVWLAGALALGALTLLRSLPPVHQEAYLAALAATAALLAALLGRLLHRRAAPGRRPAATARLGRTAWAWEGRRRDPVPGGRDAPDDRREGRPAT